MDWECGRGGSAPRSVFDEDVVKAGCLDDVLGGRDPPRAGPHPDVLRVHTAPLCTSVSSADGARIARTDGIETMIAVAARKIATVSHSVSSMPSTAETGPASAIPTGISTNEPSASYELTRDCAFSGISRWK